MIGFRYLPLYGDTMSREDRKNFQARARHNERRAKTCRRMSQLNLNYADQARTPGIAAMYRTIAANLVTCAETFESTARHLRSLVEASR